MESIKKINDDYKNWQNKKHLLTNREYYELKNKIIEILKYLKILLLIQGILIGMVLIHLIKK